MLNLSEYQKQPSRLADYLPWACIIAPGVVLNKDGSFQRTAMFRGPDLASATGEELVAICARINNALKRFGSGWALYFEACRNPAPQYPNSTFKDPAAWIVDQERRGQFMGEDENNHHYETSYYLTFAYLPPVDSAKRAENLLIEKPDKEREESASDHLNQFISETDRCLDLMGSLFPLVKFLDDDQTLTYLHTCVSPNKHKITCPDTPAYIDALIGGADLIGGLVPNLGGEHLHMISVRGFPGETTPGILDDLNHLGFSYRWMTRFLPMDKPEAVKVIGKHRRQWFAKRKSVVSLLRESLFNETSALVDNDADNKALDADEALQDLGADHVSFGYLTTCIVVSHKDALIAEQRIRAIVRVINGRGFVSIHESVNAVDAWLGSLPGHAYANIRQPIVHSLNLTHLMPLSAIWAGPKRNEHLDDAPLLYATTAGHTPFRLVPHQGDIGHMLIVGPTGAGKSVLLSLLAMQFRRYKDAQVFIFDKGRSARAACLALNGQYYDLGAENGVIFQPLKDIDIPSEITWALDWVLGLLRSEGLDTNPEIKEAIWSALQSLASAPSEQRTLTGLSALLQSNTLRQALQPYTLDGAYGHLLDGNTESLSPADMQCFEMETLMHSKALVLPVLTYLFHRLEAQFDGKPSLLILDEAWVFLDDPYFAQRIREWLKVLRKKNVSVIFSTQSLADIANSDIAPALIESCSSRIFLPNARAMEPQQVEIYARFGLNKRQSEIIAASTPKQDYYFQSRAGNRLFDLGLGEVALAFCAAGSQSEHAGMDAVLETCDDAQFASEWLRAKSLHWAADLMEAEFSLNGNSELPWIETTTESEGICAAQ